MIRISRVTGISSKVFCGQSGITFIETAVAVALMGIIAVAFLSSLATTSRATTIVDEKATAESLARSQIEWAKETAYTVNATGYPPAPIPARSDYTGYSAEITAEQLNTPDDGIQKIAVTIRRNDKDVYHIEGYKVDR